MKKFITKFDTTAELTTFSATTDFGRPHVSLTEDDSKVHYFGYEYVDLGLPSGLKWATCNVGATSPEQAGLYFAWGETTGYTGEQVTSGVRSFDEVNYTASAISTDLMLKQDAAHTYMGGKWRMPTVDEFNELTNNCDHEWTDDYNGTGVAGVLLMSRVNENSVFFPAAGSCYDSSVSNIGSNINYWSASKTMGDDAICLFFYSGYIDVVTIGDNRYLGLSVRGVCE